MIINRWMAGLLTLAIVALTGWQAVLPEGVTATEGWQFAGLVAASVASIGVPLLEGKWAAGLKVAMAVLGAAFAALVPLATGGYTPDAWVVVGLAVLNAAAVQLGVGIRADSAAAALADPKVPNAVIAQVDPQGVAMAVRAGVRSHEVAGEN